MPTIKNLILAKKLTKLANQLVTATPHGTIGSPHELTEFFRNMFRDKMISMEKQIDPQLMHTMKMMVSNPSLYDAAGSDGLASIMKEAFISAMKMHEESNDWDEAVDEI